MHCGMGRENAALVGGLRDGASVYLVVEAVLMELKGPECKKRAGREDRPYLLSLDKSL
jgi:predicted DNA-binding protein with PD1-like motif